MVTKVKSVMLDTDAAADNLANGSITAAKLAADAVETAKIKDGQVTAGKLASDAIETAKIKDDAVTTAKILNANVTPAKLSQPLTLGTAKASTSGTSVEFTGIPSWAKRITISLVGVSTSGTSQPVFQIGDSGGFETSGYLGASSSLGIAVNSANYTDGFGLYIAAAANVIHGAIVLTLVDASTFTWSAQGVFGLSNTTLTISTAGSKSLSATLDRVRITTQGGSDTFDAGAINILYE